MVTFLTMVFCIGFLVKEYIKESEDDIRKSLDRRYNAKRETGILPYLDVEGQNLYIRKHYLK